MRIKIIKDIKLTGYGKKNKDDVIEDYPDSGAEILIRKGFAKKSRKSKSDKE